MTDNNLKQAYVFERGEVLSNPNGTAPGLWVEQDGKVLVMLPGPPNELNPMFTDQVVPRLAARGCLLEREAYVQLRSAGIGESALETKLQPIFDRVGPALSVAFCAHQGAVDCRVSSPSGALYGTDLEAIAGECAGLLGDGVNTMLASSRPERTNSSTAGKPPVGGTRITKSRLLSMSRSMMT